MQKLFHMIFIVACLSVGQIYGEQNTESQIEAHVNDVDFKNVLAKVKNLVILRSYEGSFWGTDFNSRRCHLEAYDIQTGDLVWCHNDTGMIVSFIIVNDEKIIYRNYNKLTAIDANNGAVIWSKKTKGEYSTIVGE